MRPAMSDLARLAVQEFRDRPEFESAFFAGLRERPAGGPGVAPAVSARAIGTVVWAHQVGDEPFEAQVHTMIADALQNTTLRP